MKNNATSRIRTLLYLALITGVFGSLFVSLTYAQNAVNSVQNVLCGIITSISQILSILALMLFILGGTLYAFAHFLPAAGNFRGSMQGWGMGMLMGGIIALILYIIAPYIVTQIMSVNSNSVSGGGFGGIVNGQNGVPLTATECSGVGGFGGP